MRLLERRFGPGVVRRLSEARPRRRGAAAPTLSTGSLGLDLGGYPRGQLTELFGPPSAGKTTLLASALAATQRGGGLVALIDVPGMVDPEALAGCGGDLDALVLCQPADAVDALRALVLLAESAALDLLALTSIAELRRYLPPEAVGAARGPSGRVALSPRPRPPAVAQPAPADPRPARCPDRRGGDQRAAAGSPGRAG